MSTIIVIVVVVISIIILGLCSTNKQEHWIFSFLSLAYLAQHDDLKFHFLENEII
jgi:hypothetical protein